MNDRELIFAPFYQTYINEGIDKNIIEALSSQLEELTQLLNSISEEKSLYRYEKDKWSVREIVGHILDSERIFAYRALRIARNDKKPLPGFDQDQYIVESNYNSIRLTFLKEEFILARKANLIMFENFTGEMLSRTGTASGLEVNCRALLYITYGHVQHHINVLKEKYLK